MFDTKKRYQEKLYKLKGIWEQIATYCLVEPSLDWQQFEKLNIYTDSYKEIFETTIISF